MRPRRDALELARYLAYNGRGADEIAARLREEFGLRDREARRMAHGVLAFGPEVSPPREDDDWSGWPPR